MDDTQTWTFAKPNLCIPDFISFPLSVCEDTTTTVLIYRDWAGRKTFPPPKALFEEKLKVIVVSVYSPPKPYFWFVRLLTRVCLYLILYSFHLCSLATVATLKK